MPFRVRTEIGKDTLHRDPPEAACHAEEAKVIDDETAAALISIGGVRICQRCDPLADAL